MEVLKSVQSSTEMRSYWNMYKSNNICCTADNESNQSNSKSVEVTVNMNSVSLFFLSLLLNVLVCDLQSAKPS